jgi:hypothetical protein
MRHMNLFNSVFTSLIIITAFLGGALFKGNAMQMQSTNQARSPTDDKSKHTVTTLLDKAINVEYLHISGIKQRIELNDIHELWQRFSNQSALHKTLKHPPKKVFVLYNALSKNYEQADVAIGYEITVLTQKENNYTIDTSNYSILLPSDKYSELQIANAWGKIDYDKVIDYVLEVHSLNTAGENTSTQIFVYYK